MSRSYFDPHPQTRFRFWLVWLKDGAADESLGRTVQPIHISRTGIVLHLVGPAPRKDQPVWITLGEDVPDMSFLLAADIAEAKQERRGEHELRLVFREPCSDDFYRALTRGLPAEKATW